MRMSVGAVQRDIPEQEREVLAELAVFEGAGPGKVPPPDEIVLRTKAFLARKQDLLLRIHREGSSGSALMDLNTRLIDTLLRTLVNLAQAAFETKYSSLDHHLSVLAQGGYGRGKMAPFSDIDILFLYPYEIDGYIESVTEQVLLALWDVGLQVGSAVRTVADCVRIGTKDLTVRTSLMDTRFVAGDPAMANELAAKVAKEVIGRDLQGFVVAKLEESRRRHEKHGGSIFVLEPNLKDGMGGLRDYHTLLWIVKSVYKVRDLRDMLAKGEITERELRGFERSIEFMWRVRNELHFLSGRRNDQIQFEYQDQIAANFRYRTNGRQQPQERFMQHYYLHARNITECASRIVERATLLQGRLRPMMARLRQRVVAPGFKIYNGRLSLTKQDLFQKRPAAIMEAFELAQKHGIEFSPFLVDRMRENLRRIDRSFRQSPEVNATFLRILDYRKDLVRILNRMNDTRVLGRYIPEFGWMVCKVQRDAFHVYTVDVHSITAIEELVQLEDGAYGDDFPRRRQLVQELENRHELYLACLLHDVGKGWGKDHHLRGKAHAREVCARMGLSKEATDRIAFLVENHLFMVHIALKRDVNDFRLVADLARRCGDLENLNLLYLLSFADVRAVAPDVWTKWKAGLLELLYNRTYEMLERGDFEMDEMELVIERQSEIRKILEGEVPEAELDRFYSIMVNRFFIAMGAPRIARCIRIWRELGDQPFTHDLKEQAKRGTTTFIVCAPDSKGLFSKIAGVMVANNANIVSASIYTTFDGTAIDVYQVSDPLTKGPMLNEEKWKAVLEDLRRVLQEEESVEDLVARKRPPSMLGERPMPRRPTRVTIDNEASDFYTVIDVDGHDRVGLLYAITSALVEMDLVVFISRIETQGGQVDDVFYVKGPNLKKIADPERITAIRKRLLEVMEP
jgi:[protein-PII] uridylyltransferase